MIRLVAAIALPAAAVWPWLGSIRPPAARLAAAAAFGVAGSSTMLFLWRVAGGDVSIYPAIDALACLLAGAAGVLAARRARIIHASDAPPGAWLIVAAAVPIAAPAATLAARWIRSNPHGRWDAWAIWNLHAEFLAAPSDGWRRAFDAAITWSHPEYPLLVPLAVARGWIFAGTAATAVPIAIALVFTVATLVILTASLWRSRGPAVAAMGLALAATPTFVLLGSGQLADVPVALYTVLAVSLLADRPPRAAHLALAGLSLGFAAWTKSEGLIVALALPLCYVVVSWRRAGFAAARRAAVPLAAGLAPGLLVLVFFKIHLAPGDALVAGMAGRAGLARWRDWTRLALVTGLMARGAMSWGGWPVASPVWLAAFVAIARGRSRARGEAAVTAVGLLLVIQLFVFFAVYMTTPYDVVWHISTSWSRLIGQMWPTGVWWVCCRGSRGQEAGVP